MQQVRFDQGNLKPYIISTASSGEAFSDVVLARSEIDIMRNLLLTEHNWSSYNVHGEAGSNPSAKLTEVLALVYSGKTNPYDLTRQDTQLFHQLGGYSDKQIISSLPDNIVAKLFAFMFTGGEGDQEGTPGKEWTTITIRRLPDNFLSIYQNFDPNQLRARFLEQFFGRIEPLNNRRDETARRSQIQPAIFTSSPSSVQYSQPPIQNAIPKPQLTIESIIDNIVSEYFLQNKSEDLKRYWSFSRDQETLDYFTNQIETAVRSQIESKRKIGAMEGQYIKAYIQNVILDMMLKLDPTFGVRGGTQAKNNVLFNIRQTQHYPRPSDNF